MLDVEAPMWLLASLPTAVIPGGSEISGSSDARDIAINVVASILYASVVLIAGRYVIVPAYRRRTMLARALPFDRGQKSIAICHGILPPPAGSKYYSVQEGDLAAITHLNAALVDLYGKDRVATLSARRAVTHLGDYGAVAAVSGPRFNGATELLLGRLGSPVVFDTTEKLIVKKGDTLEAHVPEVGSDSTEVVCYGVVVAGRVQNAAGRRQRVVVCAGLNTLSTYGSVVFLASLREFRALRDQPALRKTMKRDRWAAILRVESLSAEGESPTEKASLDPDHISVSVVDFCGEDDFESPYALRYGTLPPFANVPADASTN